MVFLMTEWFSYIDCGATIYQTLMRNSMILSNNSLYSVDELILADKNIQPKTIALIKQIAPSYELDYIPGYGFSNKTIEDASEKFDIVINDITKCFTSPNKSRKKYLFLLGKDLCAYKFTLPLADVSLSNTHREEIISDLIGANIPTEFINALDEDISILSNRVISYLDSLEDITDSSEELKKLLINVYSHNSDIQDKLLNMLDEMIFQNNKKSNIEKIEQISSIVANTIAIASPFLPQIQESLKSLL